MMPYACLSGDVGWVKCVLNEYQLGSLKYTCISVHAVGAWGVAMVPHPILLLHVYIGPVKQNF